MKGRLKYPNILKVVKASLALSHGNATIERGFSISVRILTGDRASMCESTLNALMTTKSALRYSNNKPKCVCSHYNRVTENSTCSTPKLQKQLKEREKSPRRKPKEAREQNSSGTGGRIQANSEAGSVRLVTIRFKKQMTDKKKSAEK